MVKFREKIIEGIHLVLGKDKESNEELMKKFEGKKNTIIHTVTPGSPFCVIKSPLNPTDKDLSLSGSVCLGYSQDWRDNKASSKVDIFTGKDVYKLENMPMGTWGVKKKKTILIKKEDVLNVKKELK